MKLSLVVTQGKPEGKEIPIRLSQFLVGRDPECHLRPGSPLVSKRHAAILVRDNKVFLRDFDSTNGTIVNKNPLKGEIELKDGDEVTIGPLGFRVKISVTAQDTPKPAVVTLTERAAAPSAAKLPARKPEPKPVAAGAGESAGDVDEDSVMEMLLNLEGDTGGGAVSGNDPIPPGSTIMQIVGAAAAAEQAAGGDGSGEKKPDDKKGADKKKVSDSQSTSNAAKAILDKYMRRPRG